MVKKIGEIKGLLLLIFALSSVSVLEGCGVAVLGAEEFAVTKNMADNQKTVSGKTEVDLSKLSHPDKVEISSIRSVAVWPDAPAPSTSWQLAGEGGAAALAEGLSKGHKYEVITPSHVIEALKKLGLTDDLTQLTPSEEISAFRKICASTHADAVIYSRATDSTQHMSAAGMMIPFMSRGNQLTQFIASIYVDNKSHNDMVNIPVIYKYDMSHKRPSPSEISIKTNEKLAEAILSLSH